ncbi:hypothetical protein Poly21_55540 [Allorhodopirellula heiligendammensis]|uniref:Uncharacterized protein n=1 Tax=Allorhodopirellula heiligendammensis TaxID=2714739 RepID=A0A5C6B8K0_9BACT|nr:hypothetical protein Poly21_55540 [Allorhodopirellula heiligendammensis]
MASRRRRLRKLESGVGNQRRWTLQFATQCGHQRLRTMVLTGPPPINIDFGNDAIGGSASNALLGDDPGNSVNHSACFLYLLQPSN